MLRKIIQIISWEPSGRLLVWAVRLLVVTLGLSVSYHVHTVGRKHAPLSLVREVRSLSIPAGSEGEVYQWVYDHSSKISRRQCKVIVDEMNKYDKPLLLIAISRLESGGFDPTALSGKGAYGLMQVRYSAHKEMLAKAGVIDPRDLYDIEPNIKAGHVIITQELKQANGDITKALEGYLGGQDGYYVKKVAVDLAELYCRVYKTK